jgi:molybdate transport system regulatory protein
VRFDRDRVLGPGKAELLEAIRDTGSISAAARSLGMAYRRAWELLAEVDALFGLEAVERARGGSTRGGARLTPFGEALVARFRAMERGTEKLVARELTGLLGPRASPRPGTRAKRARRRPRPI